MNASCGCVDFFLHFSVAELKRQRMKIPENKLDIFSTKKKVIKEREREGKSLNLGEKAI